MRPLIVCLITLLAVRAADVRMPLESSAVRKPAPNFKLLDAKGKSLALSSWRGRPLLLDLWATKCGGCVREIPHFLELHHAYSRKGLAVVGVSMDILYEDLKGPEEAWKLVNPFVADHHVDYPILMGDSGFTKSYSVTSLPVSYLIDRHGRIAATYSGVVDRANIEANIKALLSEQ